MSAGSAAVRVNVSPPDLKKQQNREMLTALLHDAVARRQA